jgi:hypothetical protein
MTGYQIALFIHILTLAGASAVTAVVHLALARRRRAVSVGEALEWQKMATGTAKLFPVSLVLFVASGTYMVRTAGHSWSSGFVSAGSTAIVLLLVIGSFLGVKGGAVVKQLADMVTEHGAGHAPPQIDDTVFMRLIRFNLGLVLGVAFDMTTKPAPIAALAVMVGAGLVNAFAIPSKVQATSVSEPSR